MLLPPRVPVRLQCSCYSMAASVLHRGPVGGGGGRRFRSRPPRPGRVGYGEVGGDRPPLVAAHPGHAQHVLTHHACTISGLAWPWCLRKPLCSAGRQVTHGCASRRRRCQAPNPQHKRRTHKRTALYTRGGCTSARGATGKWWYLAYCPAAIKTETRGSRHTRTPHTQPHPNIRTHTDRLCGFLRQHKCLHRGAQVWVGRAV